MVIRLAKSSDARQLFALNEAFNGAGSNRVERIEASLRQNKNELVAVAEEGSELIGFICAQRMWSFCYSVRYAELSELYVDPAHRRLGVARALMEFIENELRAEGVEHFQLFTGGNNHQAQALYRSQGYEPTDEVQFRKRPGHGAQ